MTEAETKMAEITADTETPSVAEENAQPAEVAIDIHDPAVIAAEALGQKVAEALRTVYDPEIPVNVYDLGLIYRLDVSLEGDVDIDMTLTAPGCPVAGEMPGMIQGAAQTVEGVRDVTVNLVWDPPWDQSRMSEDARLILGFY